MVFPAGIVAVVLHLTVPNPVLGDPEPTNLGSVEGVFGITVEVVAPQSLGLTDGFAHVDGVTVNLSVLETVAGQEIILGGIGSVFELTLDTDVDTGGVNVVGPNVLLFIGTGVFGVAGIEFRAVAGYIIVLHCIVLRCVAMV